MITEIAKAVVTPFECYDAVTVDVVLVMIRFARLTLGLARRVLKDCATQCRDDARAADRDAKFGPGSGFDDMQLSDASHGPSTRGPH